MKIQIPTFVSRWLPVIIWLGFIFIGSTDLMSAQNTSRFLIPFLRWLKPDILPETLEQIHFWWRKSGHLFEYMVLGMLMIRAIRPRTQRSTNATPARSNVQRPTKILFATAWLGSTLSAALDEFHQSFVISRGAALGDVVIDSVGAIIGLVIYWLFARRSRSGFQPLRQ